MARVVAHGGFVATFLALVACPGGSDGPGVDFADPIAAKRAIAELMCETAHQCREDYPYIYPFEAMFGDDVADCLAEYTIGREELERLAEAIRDGRTEYDVESAIGCYDSLRDSDCGRFWMYYGGQDCRTMITGTQADGQPCEDAWECLADYCDPISKLCRSD